MFPIMVTDLQFWLDFYKNADEAKTNFQIYRDSYIKESRPVKRPASA